MMLEYHYKGVEHSVGKLLDYLIGSDWSKHEGTRETPLRVSQAWAELLSGYNENPGELLKQFENDGHYDQMIVVKDIDFTSFCEHHLLPFQGVAHVGYIPKDKIVGLSKLARLVDCFAKRLQVQERLTNSITYTLMDKLKPAGAGCVIEARHQCLACRGARKQNAIMVTSSLQGAFRDDPATRAEFLAFVRSGR